MDKKSMEEAIEALKIESEVTKRVRARCVAFWSGVIVVMAGIGQWLSSNILPVKAAAKAFWDAWGAK